MFSPITYDNLRLFAFSNDRQIQGEIRGIVIHFTGMGCDERFDGTLPEGDFFAGRNIVYLIPYGNPWAWMNRQESALADVVIDVLCAHYNLPEDLPIVSTGLSMGGQGALTYMVYAKRTPAACVANCPVCDMPFHYTERPDLPSSFYSAYLYEEGTMDEILPRFSPLHLAEAGKMPDAAYTVFHCTKDKSVNKELHSDRFVAAMEKAGHPVTYRIVPDREHCDLPPEEREALLEACAEGIEKTYR